MKEFISFISEKPFSCDVAGCPVRFANESHLEVHKKRHDMILNLGLGQKSTVYSDQTPTPTQFIRNCEEVGLFQDLQNVNPFEETFKKAAEAVKSGQILLDKPFNSAPPDDTLHTPNVFPHITEVPNTNFETKVERNTLCENALFKHDASISDNSCEIEVLCNNGYNTSDNIKEKKNVIQEVRESFVHKSNFEESQNKLCENKVILNIPEGHIVQLLTPSENHQIASNMVVLKSPIGALCSPAPTSVKEKLKKNLSEKKNNKVHHKVPILKCAVRRNPNLIINKFSKFSKNTMKLITKLESPNEEKNNDILTTRQKKISKSQSKESRSEFLARSRAASSRCREKKKMYLLYLEKINSELSTANKNLFLMNHLLLQQINELHNELLKHKTCNKFTESSDSLLAKITEFIRKKIASEKEKFPKIRLKPHFTLKPIKKIVPDAKKDTLYSMKKSAELKPTESNFDNVLSFDVAEVVLNDEPKETEIPLNEENKPPDIIVRFNSVGNDFPVTIPVDFNLDNYIENAGYEVQQIYGEHSYYFKKSMVDVGKRVLNLKTFCDLDSNITTKYCREDTEIQMKGNDNFQDLNSVDSNIIIGPRSPPPLILLKPFKKRSLQSNKSENR